MTKRDEARWLMDKGTAHYMIDGVSLCGKFKYKRMAWMHTANNIRTLNEHIRVIDGDEYTFCVECESMLELQGGR